MYIYIYTCIFCFQSIFLTIFKFIKKYPNIYSSHYLYKCSNFIIIIYIVIYFSLHVSLLCKNSNYYNLRIYK